MGLVYGWLLRSLRPPLAVSCDDPRVCVLGSLRRPPRAAVRRFLHGDRTRGAREYQASALVSRHTMVEGGNRVSGMGDPSYSC